MRASGRAGLDTLPVELLYLILMWLPLDGRVLRQAGLSCRRLARIVFGGEAFALSHVGVRLNLGRDCMQLERDLSWSQLPFAHKAQVLLRVLVTKGSSIQYSRRACSSRETLRLVRRIINQVDVCRALKWVAAQGHLEPIQLVLQSISTTTTSMSASISHAITSAFAVACMQKHIAVSLLLIQHPLCLCTNPQLALASRAGLFNVVQHLLTYPDIDPSYRANLPLRCSARNGHVDVVRLLLRDPRVDPTNEESCALRWAAEAGKCRVVKVLLEDGRSDLFAHSGYAFQMASRNGHERVMKLLMEDVRFLAAENDVKEHFIQEWCRRFVSHFTSW
ncbi:hypothetical protein BC830DRAFT_1164233 [Chytriomyces sp. MP71]|nr:hypothetical protein BC830DRAFT_1164233 [Chytriomyces sp. MP71]